MACWVEGLKAVRLLPAGHYDKAKAQQVVQDEYKACFELEREFLKKYQGARFLNSWQQTANFSAQLCDALGTQRIKSVRIIPHDHEWRGYVGGFYTNREIYLPGVPVHMLILVHETAHHICSMEGMYRGGGSHGVGFLDVERMLFDYLIGD